MFWGQINRKRSGGNFFLPNGKSYFGEHCFFFFFFFWGGGAEVKFTPAQTNILPEKWWLEASYFKLVPFRGDVNIGGVGV